MKRVIREAPRQSVKRIGRQQIATGMVIIQITFRDVELVISEEFMVIKDNIHTVLSMKDMPTNGLEILIQDALICFGDRTQKL